MKHLKTLVRVYDWFQSFTKISGLILKPAKCIAILTAFCASPNNCLQVRKWLATHCPGWGEMSVCSAAKYLGIFLGPTASSQQWNKALSKFLDRINNIHSLQLPAQLARL